MWLAAVASGAVAGAALSGAGTANATCASISGVGNGNGCTSTATSFALGLGNGTTATAAGTFSGAVAVGTNATAQSFGDLSFAGAFGDGARTLTGAPGLLGTPGTANIAVAVGKNASSFAIGVGNFAVAVGNPGNNPGINIPGLSGAPNTTGTAETSAEGAGTFNRAFAFGNGSLALANGGDPTNPLGSVGNNTAIALGGNTTSYAGQIPLQPLTGNTPNNQFAFSGPGKIAVNNVNL